VAESLILPIANDVDVVTARQKGREVAALVGFTGTDLTLIATAISELARNIIVYAIKGEIAFDTAERQGHRGIVVTVRDNGPGIANISLAMQDGYSTGQSLGMGLPGTKRLMDEFHIESEIGKGTTVIIKKWKR
jgi:serine/threonine-protein kinase RsbT